MDDTLTVRFRVGQVFKGCAIATYFGDILDLQGENVPGYGTG